MKNLARALALAFGVVAIGYYLWHGLTYEDDFFPDSMGWIGPQMALPIMALTIVPMVFAFTSGPLFGSAGGFGGFSGFGDLRETVMQATGSHVSGEFRDGLTGLGTVKSFHHTGVTINDQPQVRIELSVEAADGMVFHSTARVVVPLTELGLLRPGVVLPVRYVPGRTDKVMVDLSGDTARAQRVMNESMLRKGFVTEAKLDIAERGVRAQAVVQALSVTGEIRSGHSKVVLTLAVTRPDGSTFTSRSERFLAPTAVGHVQMGRIVEVRYLPENETEVVLILPVNA